MKEEKRWMGYVLKVSILQACPAKHQNHTVSARGLWLISWCRDKCSVCCNSGSMQFITFCNLIFVPISTGLALGQPLPDYIHGQCGIWKPRSRQLLTTFFSHEVWADPSDRVNFDIVPTFSVAAIWMALLRLVDVDAEKHALFPCPGVSERLLSVHQYGAWDWPISIDSVEIYLELSVFPIIPLVYNRGPKVIEVDPSCL